jgi:hypothetical protein
METKLRVSPGGGTQEDWLPDEVDGIESLLLSPLGAMTSSVHRFGNVGHVGKLGALFFCRHFPSLFVPPLILSPPCRDDGRFDPHPGSLPFRTPLRDKTNDAACARPPTCAFCEDVLPPSASANDSPVQGHASARDSIQWCSDCRRMLVALPELTQAARPVSRLTALADFADDHTSIDGTKTLFARLSDFMSLGPQPQPTCPSLGDVGIDEMGGAENTLVGCANQPACPWSGSVADGPAHKLSCAHESRICPYSIYGCLATGNFEQLKLHIASAALLHLDLANAQIRDLAQLQSQCV